MIQGAVTPGETFARALVAKDAAAMKAVLAPGIDFKAMTPGRFWESERAEDVVDDIVLGTWFGPEDHIEGLEHLESSSVAGRHRVAYRLRVASGDGTFLVEQQAYYDTGEDGIRLLRIMCSGYQPLHGA